MTAKLAKEKPVKLEGEKKKKMYCVLGSIGMDSILIIFTHFELVHQFNVNGTQTTISQIDQRAGDYKTSRTVASLLFYIYLKKKRGNNLFFCAFVNVVIAGYCLTTSSFLIPGSLAQRY